MPHLLYLNAVNSQFMRRAISLSVAKSIFFLAFLASLTLSAPLGAQVVINEMAASNDGSVDNAGKNPDWIELYNTSASTVNLAQWSLFMTNPGSSDTFTFRGNIFLDPQQYLVVWCDSDTNAPGLHTLFKIPQNDGGTLSLRNNIGGVVDTFTFGLQLTDFTVGRV